MFFIFSIHLILCFVLLAVKALFLLCHQLTGIKQGIFEPILSLISQGQLLLLEIMIAEIHGDFIYGDLK